MLHPQLPARGIDCGSAIALPRMTSLRTPGCPVPGKGDGHTDQADTSLPGPSPRLSPTPWRQ
eukprot:4722832-Pyramimonas_sp.AAC.1